MFTTFDKRSLNQLEVSSENVIFATEKLNFPGKVSTGIAGNIFIRLHIYIQVRHHRLAPMRAKHETRLQPEKFPS